MVALLAGCGTAEFGQARDSLRDGKYYIAMEHYLSFVKNHPKHRRAPEAIFEVGNLQHMVLGEPEKAVETFQNLVKAYPVGPYTLAAQKRLAEIHKNVFSDYQRAIIDYEKFLHAAPNHKDTPDVLMELAHCYTLTHNFAQAEIEYDRLIRAFPKYPRLDEAYFQKGNNYFISGDYEKAVATYQYIPRAFTQSHVVPQAIFGMANAYEEMDDFEHRSEEHTSELQSH